MSQVLGMNLKTSLWQTGYQDGKVDTWIVDSDLDGNLTVETRFKGGDSFEGPISDITNFDIDGEDGS